MFGDQIASDQLGTLISTVRQALVGLGKPAIETEMDRTPAVPIRRSVHRDYVVCLECGWRGQMLRRHLATAHGLSVDKYRPRWSLPREHSGDLVLDHRATAAGKRALLGQELRGWV
jgi:predicted transcriptional regulator